jgi:Tfp pilus assembly protein FimT
MSTPVETPMESQSGRERSTIYIVVAVVLAILLIIGLITFSSEKSTQAAEQKADQLIAALEAEGARTPTRDQIVHVLGDDGGATCSNPNDALSRGILLSMLSNGAAGPGIRPVIADSRVVQGQLLIIKIYCPDELPDFQEFVDDLKTDDVAG